MVNPTTTTFIIKLIASFGLSAVAEFMYKDIIIDLIVFFGCIVMFSLQEIIHILRGKK